MLLAHHRFLLPCIILSRDVRDKLNDKKMKLEQAKLQLHELQKNTSHIEARNRDIKADLEKTAISYQQQIINKIWA